MNNDEQMIPSDKSVAAHLENLPPEVLNEAHADKDITSEKGMEKAKHPKRKIPLVLAVITAIIIIAVTATVLFLSVGKKLFSASAAPKQDTTNAYIAEDGTAYIVDRDGNVITINGDVSNAVLTADQKHIVILLKDNTLYFTDEHRQGKTRIADNVRSLSYVRNDGFFYIDEDFIRYRVTFSDAASVKLGEVFSLTVASNTLSALYATDTGIYTLPYNCSEENKVGIYNGVRKNIRMNAISDDGQISVWTLYDGDQSTLILNEGDERTTLGTIGGNNINNTFVEFTSDQNLVVVANRYGDQMYIKKRGEDTVKVKFGSRNQFSTTVYTSVGELSKQTLTKVDGLYVGTSADSGVNIYNITLSGDRERVLSKVSRYHITNGKIIYLKTDGNLYYAKLSGATVTDENKIASDVEVIRISENGNYIFFLKDIEDGSGSLYCYKVGELTAKKVASDVYCRFPYQSFQIGTDGSTVYYLKDTETFNNFISYGMLYSWTYLKEESVKLASDVMSNYMDVSGMEINGNGLTFFKYSSVGTDDNIYCDLYYYNGKESSKVASDIKW